MSIPSVCPICRQEANIFGMGPLQLNYSVACQRCGNFFIEDNFISYSNALNEISNGNTYIFSVAARRAITQSDRTNGRSGALKITMDNAKDILNSVIPRSDVVSAAEDFLIYLSEEQKEFSAWKKISAQNDYPLASCKNHDDFVIVISYLIGAGYIRERGGRSFTEGSKDFLILEFRLSPAGFQKVGEIGKTKNKKEAFVAMWFNEKEAILKGVYEASFKKSIEDTTSLKSVRADKEEFNDDINDWIQGHIRQSAFLIADFTGLRGGVYFEAGYALGLGIPVIFTCFDSEENKKNLHFDTNHRNHIFWKTPEQLYDRLVERIGATISSEYLKK